MRLLRFIQLLLAVTACGVTAAYGLSPFNFTTGSVQVSFDGFPTSYKVVNTMLPDFNGQHLGTVFVGTNSLTLVGGQVDTQTRNFGDPQYIRLSYRIFETGNTPGAFATTDLSTADNSNWTNFTLNFDLLAGITAQASPVSYSIEIYFFGEDLLGVQNTSTATATFTVGAIPEPANLSVCCGVLALLGARFRRSFAPARR